MTRHAKLRCGTSRFSDSIPPLWACYANVDTDRRCAVIRLIICRLPCARITISSLMAEPAHPLWESAFQEGLRFHWPPPGGDGEMAGRKAAGRWACRHVRYVRIVKCTRIHKRRQGRGGYEKNLPPTRQAASDICVEPGEVGESRRWSWQTHINAAVIQIQMMHFGYSKVS